jgi:hypothetical protein
MALVPHLDEFPLAEIINLHSIFDSSAAACGQSPFSRKKF